MLEKQEERLKEILKKHSSNGKHRKLAAGIRSARAELRDKNTKREKPEDCGTREKQKKATAEDGSPESALAEKDICK